MNENKNNTFNDIYDGYVKMSSAFFEMGIKFNQLAAALEGLIAEINKYVPNADPEESNADAEVE